MRMPTLVSLLVVGGLMMAAPLGLSAGSSDSPPSSEATSTPAPSPADPPQASAAPAPTAEPTPSALTHRTGVLQQFFCENCHGTDSGWLLPDTHATLQGQTCESCHAPAPEPSPIAIHFVPGDTATQELCTLCHTDQVQLAPRPVAPRIAATQACASCHGDDELGAPPEDHAGRSVATCSLCHQTQTLAAQAVPHKVEGWEQCSFCHGDGLLAPLKGGHKDLKDDECLRCHDAVRDPPSMPKAMLDHSELKGGCTSCHGEGLVAPLPADHAERTEVTCALCHSATGKKAPLVPHSLIGQRACSSCHASETLVKLGGHTNLRDEACAACHLESPGGVPSIPHALSGRTNCTDCHAPASHTPAKEMAE